MISSVTSMSAASVILSTIKDTILFSSFVVYVIEYTVNDPLTVHSFGQYIHPSCCSMQHPYLD